MAYLISHLKPHGIVALNLGQNNTSTHVQRAAIHLLAVKQQVIEGSVSVSSPSTTNLRGLFLRIEDHAHVKH